MLKTPASRFNLHGRYQISPYTKLYKPKYLIWCESNVPFNRDSRILVGYICEVLDQPFAIPISFGFMYHEEHSGLFKSVQVSTLRSLAPSILFT